MILRRVGPMSLAKVSGFLYALLGLVIGALFALISFVGGALTGESSGPIAGMVFGVGAIVFLPLLYGGFGFVFSLLGAVLYNWAAGLMGGIEIQMADAAPGTDPANGP